jgi:pimeloyl-ACP methyl ester carboxylesterase
VSKTHSYPADVVNESYRTERAKIRGDNHAFGWPGLEPRWTHGDKDGIGTAYSAASRIWFTVWNGIPGAGHYLPEEEPEYLTVELLRLLRMSEVERYLEPQESLL